VPITVLHVAPHPDDELVGAGATLIALRRAGHRVINLACGLGHAGQHERRLAEVREACRIAGFELVVHDPPLPLDRPAEHAELRRRLASTIRALARREGAAVVAGPSPHDGHPAHELVGAALCDALEEAPGPALWLWGVWADLPWPTLYSGFGESEMAGVIGALEAHAGELERNDYRTLVRGRAAANRCLGAERVFGFGSAMRSQPYAELLTEVRHRDGEWWAARARELDVGDPLGRPEPDRRIGWWLRSPSLRALMARQPG
jgi:LmbE family N-acetylglucosaminyl deacetylase